MKTLAMLPLIALATLGAAATAEAAPGPWCLRYDIGSGVVRERCDFVNFDACRAERAFWSSTAFCSPNPGYAYAPPRQSRRNKRAR